MYERELETICRVAHEAGALVMQYYRANAYSVETKSDSSPVTDADRASDALIRKRLSEEFPGYAILSEETADSPERLSREYCFIVDPIDGTKEFIGRNGEFSINIALCRAGSIVAGAVCVPVRDELYFASAGNGAYMKVNGTTDRIRVSSRAGNPRIAVSRSHRTSQEDALIEKLCAEETIVAGSSYKGCLVAKGAADIYCRCGSTMEWDAAPLQIIVEEAGGIMRHLDGRVPRYNKPDPVHGPYAASNGRIRP